MTPRAEAVMDDRCSSNACARKERWAAAAPDNLHRPVAHGDRHAFAVGMEGDRLYRSRQALEHVRYAPSLHVPGARYIEGELRNNVYSVARQEFSVDGTMICNIEATIVPRGNAATTTLVVGAHYESYEDSPGANDNASGAAAVLELARLLKDWQPGRTRLHLVLFVNEEPPYYRTSDMGSWRYAKRLADSGEHVLGMMALETIGAFSDAPNSQRYPFPFGMIFPRPPTSLPSSACPAHVPFCTTSSARFAGTRHFLRLVGLLPTPCRALAGLTTGLSTSSGFRQS